MARGFRHDLICSRSSARARPSLENVIKERRILARAKGSVGLVGAGRNKGSRRPREIRS